MLHATAHNFKFFLIPGSKSVLIIHDHFTIIRFSLVDAKAAAFASI
jgi:hypothetical protein